MATREIHEEMYDEAELWLGSGCNVEINVAGTWISVQRLINGKDGIVKCDTDKGAMWFPLEELKGIREAEGELNVPASTCGLR